MRIGKIFRFEAAHVLPNHPGKCHNIHGHSYKLEVEVEGEVNPDTGMVMDFGDLEKMFSPIVSDFDHSLILPAVFPQISFHNEFQKVLRISPEPTAECILMVILDWLVSWYHLSELPIPNYRLRLWETESCYAEVSNG